MTALNVATIDKPFLVEQRNVILIPDDPKYHVFIPPNAKVMLVENRPFYILKNSPRMNKLLRDAGYPVLSPLYFDKDYNWSAVKPFAAQVESAALLIAHHKLFNLSDLGTGKTYSTLFAIDWLIKNNYAKTALIFAPLSILHNVWLTSIMTKFPRLKGCVLHGTAEKRLKLLRTPGFNVMIINHDGAKVIGKHLALYNFDIIVVDELGSYRDVRSARWKATAPLVHKAKFAVGLTGSPTPTGPWDAYAQRMLLRPQGFNYSYTQFKRLVGVEVRPNIWLPKKDSETIVFNTLQPAVRFIRSQVVELKNNYTHTIKVSLSQAQVECRDRLIKEALALYKEGEVRADNAAALSTKILQASLGAVYTSGEERVVIDLKNTHRLEVTAELIGQAAGKVIVAVPYVSMIDIVAKELQSKKILLSVIRGSVSPKDRNDIFNRFQDPLDPLRVIVAQPSCMAHGVTLTEADTIIWYGPVMKYEVFQQFNGRIIRPGQKRTQLIYLLEGSEIEKRFYSALRSNGVMQETILGMFQQGAF